MKERNLIENQTEKYTELCQEIESIIEALNELPAWAQSIDEAKDRAKELQRKFNCYDEVDNMLLTDDQLQEVFNNNKQVLYELEGIKNYLNSWLEADDVEYKKD